MNSDLDKLGVFDCLFLTMARVYKQWVCPHPPSKRYKTGTQFKCYNCDKVIK